MEVELLSAKDLNHCHFYSLLINQENSHDCLCFLSLDYDNLLVVPIDSLQTELRNSVANESIFKFYFFALNQRETF